MDAQAGWYDDGSGRQRYWDGSQWTNNYGTPRSNISTTPVPPILGYVGLGSAVVGTILACIPLTFILGVIVLVASFVVSLIGLFIKNTVKWPSIVGIILSVIGGAIGTVIVFFFFIFSLNDAIESNPLVAPTTSAQPSDSPTTESSEGRTPPDVIAVEVEKLITSEGLNNYESLPDFFPCVGEELYNSEMTDETLWLVITGEDPLEAERDLAEKAIQDAIFTCDPEGAGGF